MNFTWYELLSLFSEDINVDSSPCTTYSPLAAYILTLTKKKNSKLNLLLFGMA